MTDAPPLDVTQKVQEVITRWPRTAQVFTDLRAACVGCQMARFCTIEDVALNYGLDPGRLADALRREQDPALNHEGVLI